MRAAGAKQVAEKGLGLGEFQYRLLQGLKPNVDLMGFSGPAKAVPLLQSMSEMRFSAACKVVPSKESSVSSRPYRTGIDAGHSDPGFHLIA